uniref:TLC domain-containing protein n=1 Tax=Aegilops tauschii subsp. strangulata TaxID=200361 RepID=A0A453H1N2_AEGTS
TMAMAAYSNQAQAMMRDYLLADPLVPYTSVLIGVFLCKMAYDLTRILSSFYFKGYSSLTKIQRVEWNNRGMSSAHAIFIAAVSVYLVASTDLFSDRLNGPITFRSSIISTSALGVSVGYFITDLAMIFWLFPSLGGMEYVGTPSYSFSGCNSLHDVVRGGAVLHVHDSYFRNNHP